jgi:hypothetical protein
LTTLNYREGYMSIFYQNTLIVLIESMLFLIDAILS